MNRLEIKQKAQDLIKKYSLIPPFNIFEIAKYLGINALSYKSEDLLKIIKERNPEEIKSSSPDDIFGYFDYKSSTVYINSSNQTNLRKRFTMAHEIAHFYLHQNVEKNQFRKVFTRENLYDSNKYEVEANYFASYLLVPDELIISTLPYTKLMIGGEYMIRELSKLFVLSIEATRVRLKLFKEDNPQIWEEYNLTNQIF